MAKDDFKIKVHRLGSPAPIEVKGQDLRIIESNQKIAKIHSLARERAKSGHCLLCNKPCSSFCNSHSVPQFSLRPIADNGILMSPLQKHIPSLGKNLGVNNAGTFFIICDDCDNTRFQEYETPSAYSQNPTTKMLAQIAIKNYLFFISRRKEEIEISKILKEMAYQFGFSSMDAEYIGLENAQQIEEYDLANFQIGLADSINSLSSGNDSFTLCYYKVLDYIVPYAAQSAINLVSDFDDAVINDLFVEQDVDQMKQIHFAVFPLEKSSVVLAFTDKKTNCYQNFTLQLNKMDMSEQLSVINYILFLYTENIFINPNVYEQLQKSPEFIDVCRKSTLIESPVPFLLGNPTSRLVQEFSLKNHHKIPNLLSSQYALSTER